MSVEALGMKTYIQHIILFVPNLIFMEYGKRCFVVWLFDAVKFKGIYGFAVLFKAVTFHFHSVSHSSGAEIECEMGNEVLWGIANIKYFVVFSSEITACYETFLTHEGLGS